MSLIEIGLSFLEGLALIASPCILPVLPLVLAGSVEGGRRRPFGIIMGFVSAFTLFALLSRQLVMVLGIDLELIKYIALGLLALFGVILLSEKWSSKFNALTQNVATMGSNLSNHAKAGFGSGLFIGVLIGLVWTPCAGPILAAALVQVIREQNNWQAVWLIAAFAFGAGMPMLAISLTGRRLIGKLGFFKENAELIRKLFGVVLLLTSLFIASGVNVQSLIEKKEVSIAPTQNELIHALAYPYLAPEFSGIGTWINSAPLTMSRLKGKVVLVDFWTYSCINCLRTLPFLIEWDHKYRELGLTIIGVHAPEFEFEKNPKNVENAITAYHITYPVALDNHLDTWTNFNNLYWPAHYLIDRTGRVVYTHFGEGAYGITEHNIRFLLGLNKRTFKPDTVMNSIGQTPETYLGQARATRFSKNVNELPLHHWTLLGKWRVEDQRIIAEEPGAKLRLHFKAGKVFLVMGVSKGQPITVCVKLNGEPIRQLTIEQHQLYELPNQQDVKQGVLELISETSGLEAYAFTFGN
ncbi:MAG TPA: cytochrome c biogenesis protein DipZ [Legionellaceae bacterium]|nr:cytochrome c biogenesis protein DipZ [Legionellaceae bacterium]